MKPRPNIVVNFFAAGIILFVTSVRAQKLTSYVDPFIGTAAHGHVFLGANVPFGAVQLGPANIMEGWDWCSGYNYVSNTIVGFTHTHLSGTGIGDLNDILLMPFTGKTFLNPGTKENPDSGYLSTFSHTNEICRPGYYSVLLDKYDINAELTASSRVGFHRYTFPKDGAGLVMLDLNFGVGWDQPVKTMITVVDDSTITGFRFSKGWAEDQRIYFYLKLSQPLSGYKMYEGNALAAGKVDSGRSVKAVMDFKVKASQPLEIKVAISSVSIENAKQNMEAELPHWDFDRTVADADQSWENEFSKIVVEANTATKKVFYTSLYHTMFAPSEFSDVNGDYYGADKQVHHAPNDIHYTTFSLWDTYRALHPLFTIMQPSRVNDIIRTFLDIYQQQGLLPVWHLMGNETFTMNGNHAIPIIFDAYQKGFRDYDVSLAYEAMKTSALSKRKDMAYPGELRFIPSDTLAETVSNALEYAIDDWCIAQMAQVMGKTEDAEYFAKRSQLYKMYFDSNRQFMRPRLENGNWKEPFNPFTSIHMKGDYVEGNGWQYTWLVPQEPHSLIQMFGGDEKFITKLDSLFFVQGSMGPEASPDISGLIGQYAQGNEPNHHIPYLYAFAGEQSKTAQRVRQIIDTFYTTHPNGLCGNEDLGQMSAWYVFSAMGFYPVNPANGIYVLGSPALNEVTIRVDGGKTFNLRAIGNSKKNIYIQKAEYNGKPYTKSYITQEMIVKGGLLRLFMGDTPSQFGSNSADRP